MARHVTILFMTMIVLTLMFLVVNTDHVSMYNYGYIHKMKRLDILLNRSLLQLFDDEEV